MVHSLPCKALISKPTRITEQSSTLIDHNDTKHAIVSGTSNFDVSNLPTFSIVKAADINTTSNNYTVRKNFCINDFFFDLYQQLSQSIHYNEDSTVNSQFETFVDIFQTVVNNHAPLCNASRKQKIMRQKPWLTPGIYKSILTESKMYHKVYNKKNTPLYNMYKVYRNNLKNN